MITLTKIRAWFKHRKPRADDNIERSEPEFILANTQDYIFGLIIAALWMMIAYAFMTDQATDWIARMLLLIDGTFEERLATLTAVFVLFSDALVIIGVAINREPSNGDIVDVVNDVAEQIDERFAEIENHITQETGDVLREVQDLTVTTHEHHTRKESVMEFLNALDPMVKLLIMVGGVVLVIAVLTVGKRRD